MRNLGYTLRTLLRAPGFSAIVVVTLAMAIGANTAVFSIVHAVLLRPLPYRQPERLVAIWDHITSEMGMSKLFVQYRDLEQWQAHSQTFEQFAGVTWATGGGILTGYGPPRNVLAIPATLDLFRVLGVVPMLGRGFERDDLSRGCTLVLTHKFWQNALGAPRDLARLNLGLDDHACVVAGVMPPGFTFFPEPTAMWVLVTPNNPLVRSPEHTGGLGGFGRLKPGVSVAAAQAELKVLSAQIDRGIRYGAEMQPMVYPLQQEFTFLAGHNLQLSLIVLFAAVGFVLLIACVNVANLLLGRALNRQRELAIRAALGSGRGRLLRQLLTESLVLSMIAATLGAGLAVGAVRAFRLADPVQMPVGADVSISLPVLFFTVLLAILTTVLAGLLPAWKASKVDLLSTLKTGVSLDPGRHRLTRGLIVAEVSLSLVLLIGAGLLIESVSRFASAPLGFEPRGLLTVQLTLPSTTPAQRVAFFDRVMESFPGVALSNALPLRGGRGVNVLVVEGQPYPTKGNAVHDIGEQSVTPDYFRLLGIAVERGRPFEWSDRAETAPVAVINEAVARKYFPGEDPLGRHIRFYGDPDATNPWLTIVGVVANEKRTTPYQEMAWDDSLIVYHALAQKAPPSEVSLLFRAPTSSGIAEGIREIAPGVVVGSIETAEHLVSRYIAYPRFRAILLGGFAGVALLLAVVGLYGVLSQLAAQRTREIGVRMALGATNFHVLRLVVGEGMRLAAVGVVIGLVASAWLTRFLASLLFGVRAHDPLTLGAVSLMLLTAAFLAAYLPARRASLVDPMVALRHE